MAGDSDSSEASCYYTRSLQLFRFIFESLFVILFIIELVIRWASLKRSDTCNHCNHCSLLESHWFLTSQHVIFQAINFLSWWMEYLWRDRWILRLVEVNCAALISEPHSESSQLTPAGLLSSFADFYVGQEGSLTQWNVLFWQLVLASGVDCFVLSLIGIGGQAGFYARWLGNMFAQP